MRTKMWFADGAALFVILAITTLCTVSVRAESTDEFRWIDAQRDHVLWVKVAHAFRTKLKPDIPNSDAFTYDFKYINRVGVFGESALVIVGYRTKDDPDDQAFSAFTYDLTAGTISKVINPQDHRPLMMWQWKVVKLAQFEPGVARDIVFTYLNCWGCEPDKMLSAFHYDQATHHWEMRQWGNGKPQWWRAADGLVIETDASGGDETVSYDCLYGLLDLNHDGLDSLAIRCREVLEPTKNKFRVNDTTVLYSFKDGNFAPDIIADKDRSLMLLARLCEAHNRNELCKVTPRAK